MIICFSGNLIKGVSFVKVLKNKNGFNIRAFSTQFAILALAILFLYKQYTGKASIVMKSSLLIIGLVNLVMLHFKVFWREDLKFIERIKK